ncbi:non-specific lipid transfer protein GPI-anchored 4-like [Corylus avellana]|uniref:non-specific lipid transfer protein GPI-anchored 4-like n=1 Tax=Corylus avellana TaxID=13451 RepID=UPI001E238038|nr:non-specific lipid transfer protein GPI-anchored 4-like [Corylus avellana]
MAATRVAAMVAAAIFFSTFYSASTQAPAPSVTAEAPAPSALAGCSDILLNLSGCLTYVEEGSNLTKPEKDCCPALAGLVESHPVCLCVLLEPNATQSYGISIDSKKALKLPSVCGVQTPPATACSAFGVPVPGPIGAPTGSEGPSISPAIEEATAPSVTGEAPAPSALAGCSDILLNLTGCLTYVEAGSNLTKPEKDCCPALAGLVESNPVCLCLLLEPNATQGYGISIDSKKALKLPSVCGVQTPPATACSPFGVPVPGPIGAPTGSEGSSGAQAPEGVAPTPGNSVSEASSIVGSGLPITVGLVIAFLPTFF